MDDPIRSTAGLVRLARALLLLLCVGCRSLSPTAPVVEPDRLRPTVEEGGDLSRVPRLKNLRVFIANDSLIFTSPIDRVLPFGDQDHGWKLGVAFWTDVMPDGSIDHSGRVCGTSSLGYEDGYRVLPPWSVSQKTIPLGSFIKSTGTASFRIVHRRMTLAIALSDLDDDGYGQYLLGSGWGSPAGDSVGYALYRGYTEGTQSNNFTALGLAGVDPLVDRDGESQKQRLGPEGLNVDVDHVLAEWERISPWIGNPQ